MKAKDRPIQNKSLLRNIPSIQELLNDPLIQENSIDAGYKKKILELEVQKYRGKLLSGRTDGKKGREDIHKELVFNSITSLERLKSQQLKRVINGTGIILHTNLGRAPVAEIARQHLQNILEHYCSLEIDLDSGKRGDRTDLVEEVICLITGAEAAVVVNNNAAAILLALNSLCRNKEVPVSRGELVEIGGSFRMPEVMKAGQVRMVEVGTTNKTHLRDYRDAIGERTAGILKVHTSNYRIMGFTGSVPIEELVALAGEHKIPLIYDMGSGVLEDLEKWGFSPEPVAREYIESGVDVVTATPPTAVRS